MIIASPNDCCAESRRAPGSGQLNSRFLGCGDELRIVQIKGLRYVSGAAEGLVAPLHFRWGFGKGGKLRLIVKRAREDI
jgi:hypothetical protein